jgi:3-dehydroquinate synthetase/predicted NBD/HSP70 family sugar kinase
VIEICGAHVVIDIGGTWFRAARREPDGTLSGLSRHPAVNYLNHPDLSQEQLRRGLVDYILGETRRLADGGGPQHAAISMGAALNAHTGEILDSGPLWGPESEPFDLGGALAQRRPEVRWSVVNDVTALAFHFAHRYPDASRLAVVTVSSGIAARIIETRSGRVPVHRNRGVQGEIGHIPIDFHHGGRALHLRCDCGGDVHLNAYCSGRGIPQVMRHLAAGLQRPEWVEAAADPDPGRWVRVLRPALDHGDEPARALLDAVMTPLARSLVTMLAVDPEIDRLVITGGVPHALGPAYQEGLLRAMESLGLYMISDADPDHFRKLVSFGTPTVEAGLDGAALAAGASAATSLQSQRRRRMVETQRVAYEVTIACADASAAVAAVLSGLDGGTRPVIMADENVAGPYGEPLAGALRSAGLEPTLATVASGEDAKSWRSIEKIVQAFASAGVSRRDHVVVALGGGALLDAVGLAAGLYRRGVPYIRVPTSLIGLIDAGVGAKVGINYAGHKNRLGLFYPPAAVVLDAAFLKTLPVAHLVSGVAEMVKIALVADRQLFERLEAQAPRLADPAFYSTEAGFGIMACAADAMMSSLSGNLFEQNLERPADFGHSVSPALEMATHPVSTHGEAVAIDMALFLEIGRARGVTEPAQADRILRLFQSIGLPVHRAGVTVANLVQALAETRLHRGGRQRLPMVAAIGARPVFVDDVDEREVTAAWARLARLNGGR